MNALEKQFKKISHRWTDHIISINQKKVPKELRQSVTGEEYGIICEMPYLVSDEEKVVIVNECFPNWVLLKDLFVILDGLPKRYLVNILESFKSEYKALELGKLEYETNEELLEKMLYCLIPEILKVKIE